MKHVNQPESGDLPRGEFWDVSKLMVVIVFWVVVFLIQMFDWHYTTYRALILLFILITTPILIGLAGYPSFSFPRAPRAVSRGLIIACVVLLCFQLIYFLKYFFSPRLSDVATTTLAAGDALLAGKNPYQLSLDPQSTMLPDSPLYQGYKYLPIMAVMYLPLSALLGERGLLLTNLLLHLAVVWLVFLLASLIGTQSSGLFAAFLYLMLPIVPKQIFGEAVTDLAAIVPLLGGLLWVEKSPGVTGLLVGLSISTKLLPGVLFVPCCLPASHLHRWWYAAGIVMGLLPTLVFVFWSPVELFSNIVYFNSIRPPDSTSWLYQMPPAIVSVARAVFAVVWLSTTAYVWFKPPTVATRCGLGVICILCALLSGPISHSNFQLWWLPIFAVLLGVVTLQASTSRTSVKRGVT